MKPLLTFLALLIGLPTFGQSTWRNFFTTNQNPIVEVVAGSNATVQASTVGVNLRRFTVNSTATGGTNSGTQTNISWTAVTNLQSSQMPYTVITNPPWQYGSANLTNWALITTNYVPPQSGHATNADFVSGVLTNQTYASNVISGGQIINGGVETNQLENGYLQLTGDKRRTTFDLSLATNVMGFDGTGAAGTNWVLEQLSTLGAYTYFLGPTNTFAITNSGETVSRTNVWSGSIAPYQVAATQSVGGLVVGAYTRTIISTNTFSSLNDVPIEVVSFPFRSSGGGTITAHYEVYWVDAVSNIMHEISSGPIFTIGAVVPTEVHTTMQITNTYIFTNRAYISTTLKIDGLGGVPGGATISFAYGGAFAAHLTFATPLSGIQINGSQIVGPVSTATYVLSSPITNQTYASNVISGGQITLSAIATNTAAANQVLTATSASTSKWGNDGNGLTNVTHSIQTIVGGGAPTFTTSAFYLSAIGSAVSGSSSEASVSIPFVTGGILTNLTVKWVGSGAGTNMVATIFTNGAASSVVVSITGNGGTVTGSDTSHSVIAPANVLISMKFIGDNASAPSGHRVMWSFEKLNQ